MKNREYWQERNIQLEEAAHTYGSKTYEQVKNAFEQALRDTQKEIDAWYGRFAKNNSVTIQEARKKLNASELDELKWDVEQYIKYGQENAINSQWMKQLENASAKFHISRLEALKIRTQQASEAAFCKELDDVKSMAEKVYTSSYYHGIYEMQKGFNIGWDIGRIDNNKLNRIITKPWAADGKNFSDRIWQSKQQLVNDLHTELTRNCILGEEPDKLIKSIASKYDVAKSQASRLIMTEQAYFHSAAQEQVFNDLDIEEYEIVAILDRRTSKICRSMDGKHFPMSEYAAGVTAPPFHPNCRSITSPYFDDEFSNDGMRAARNENGKTYYVPANMSYEEWEKKHVADAASDADKAMYERYKGVLKELSPKNLEDFVNIKYNDKDKWERLKYQYRTVNRYEVDGDVPIQTILDLDKAAFYTKKTGFDFSTLSGEERCKVKQLTRCGNAASMLLDGKTYFSHSRFDVRGSLEIESYIGEYTPVGLSKKPLFNVKDLGDGVSRQYDTEAKFLEYVAGIKKPSDKFVVTILSEKHICESCQGVVKQFQKMFPNATINVVSGKLNYNSSEMGLKTWKHRKKVQRHGR